MLLKCTLGVDMWRIFYKAKDGTMLESSDLFDSFEKANVVCQSWNFDMGEECYFVQQVRRSSIEKY